ncbi:MAG: hypothetical protein Q8911_07700 [Bacillota bacterium]|nr:hypothetical protein [Bacillota bacterium]
MAWLKKLMAGRYGIDQLSIALLITYVPLSLAAQVTRLKILDLFALALIAVCYLRIFSRNIAKRREENGKFLVRWYPIKNWISSKLYRLKDSKEHRYYKCPNCKQAVRVPKGKGAIRITCPKCKTGFLKST